MAPAFGVLWAGSHSRCGNPSLWGGDLGLERVDEGAGRNWELLGVIPIFPEDSWS